MKAQTNFNFMKEILSNNPQQVINACLNDIIQTILIIFSCLVIC